MTYTDVVERPTGKWASLDLTQGSPSTRWTGSLDLTNGPASSQVRYMVQAVNGVGLVSLDTNLGAYFTPAPFSVPQPVDRPPTSSEAGDHTGVCQYATDSGNLPRVDRCERDSQGQQPSPRG